MQKLVSSIAAIQKPSSSNGQAAGNNERKPKAAWAIKNEIISTKINLN